ncbi:hypothetical protein KCU76_g110, partial [Aureobasidium melanogenum]
MRRVLAPIAIAVKRAHHDWSVVHARPAKTSTYECWVSSNSTKDVTASKVELKFISIATGKEIKRAMTRESIKITANERRTTCPCSTHLGRWRGWTCIARR